MDLIGRNSGTITPVKELKPNNRSKNSETPKKSENSNPNRKIPDPKLSAANSKSAKKSQKSAIKIKNPNFASICTSPSPKKKIRERKFVVAKKNVKREESKALGVDCKCNANGGKSLKCLCVAYENLRASQEGFFKNRVDSDGVGVKGEDEVNPISQNPNIPIGCEEKLGKSEGEEQVDLVLIKNPRNPKGGKENLGESSERGSLSMKRGREKLLDNEGIESGRVAEPVSGRVLSLVKAFENLYVMPKTKESDDGKGMKWGLPVSECEDNEGQVVSPSSFCPSDFVFTSESLGLDSSRVSSSLDGSQRSLSVARRISGGGQRSRRKSCDSSTTFGGRQCKRRNRKVTSQKPFNLRTEQRGRSKEEEFTKKVQEMMTEEEKLRIPVAQGLPWTTDEPECLAKPPVKECTRPLDLVLHSDVRAVERAEFDHQVIEKMSFVEQYRTEKERQQKSEEEEEIRRFRKELVPRAQPIPYFDRPFVPRRSEKHPTIPKEPRFHLPQNKKIKSCMFWSEMYAH